MPPIRPYHTRDYLGSGRWDGNAASAYSWVESAFETLNGFDDTIPIPEVLVMGRSSGSWRAENLADVMNWQADFARNYGHYVTMSNPIVRAVHQGHANFLGGAVALSGNILSYGGIGVSAVGYALSVFGGAGAPLIAIGTAMNKLGTVISVTADLGKGNYVDAGVTGITYGIFGGLGKLGSLANFTPMQNGIYNLIFLPPSIALDIATSSK